MVKHNTIFIQVSDDETHVDIDSSGCGGQALYNAMLSLMAICARAMDPNKISIDEFFATASKDAKNILG